MIATLPSELVARLKSTLRLESELETRYLADDLDDRCACAVQLGDPVFIACAALPLQKRKEAVTRWRQKQVGIFTSAPGFIEFRNATDPQLFESLAEGLAPLARVLEMFTEWIEEKRAARAAVITRSKDALRRSVGAACRDGVESPEKLDLPRFAAILETGEVGLFRKRHACVEWGRLSNCRFLLCAFDTDGYSVNPGPEVR